VLEGSSDRVTIDPVIVPPTWNKGAYHQQFKDLWRCAADNLAEAENIIVIGYSAPLSDHFYRQLFSISTISDSILDRYICIGPRVGENHRSLIGGVGESRKIFHETNDFFSRCYGPLLHLMPDMFPDKMFNPHKTAETFFSELAAGRA
jgi:hypothetical protein